MLLLILFPMAVLGLAVVSYLTMPYLGVTEIILYTMVFLILFFLVFVTIFVATTPEYGNLEVEKECEITPFTLNGNDVYAVLDIKDDKYILLLAGNTFPTKYPSSKTSIVYIDENDVQNGVPRIRQFVQRGKWTWYSAPSPDRRTYTLYVPKGSILSYSYLLPD